MRVSSLLFAVAAAGCATASSPQNNEGGDAHLPADAAPPPGDSRAMTDGSVAHDGPVTPDAPAGSCATPSSGPLASWNFAAEAGNQASTAASSTATGLTASAMSRSSGLTATSGAGSINSSNWPSAATLDPTKYYTVILTPPAGCLFDVTSMAIDAKASTTGPNTAKVATSADSFTATAGVAVTTTSTPALAVAGASGMVEIRIYGYGASSSTGTLRIQNTLTISGSLH